MEKANDDLMKINNLYFIKSFKLVSDDIKVSRARKLFLLWKNTTLRDMLKEELLKPQKDQIRIK